MKPFWKSWQKFCDHTKEDTSLNKPVYNNNKFEVIWFRCLWQCIHDEQGTQNQHSEFKVWPVFNFQRHEPI